MQVKDMKKKLQYDEKQNKVDDDDQHTIEEVEMRFRESKNKLSEHEKNVISIIILY